MPAKKRVLRRQAMHRVVKRRAAAINLFDQRGAPISREQFDRLILDEAYHMPRHYLNDKIEVILRWVGFVPDAAECPREYWKLFRVRVCNRVNGNAIEDPVLSKNFATREDAENYYGDVLVEHTDSYWTPTGTREALIEVGNQFAPPPPPQPIADRVSPETFVANSSAGSW
jgi:hypothetical protein